MNLEQLCLCQRIWVREKSRYSIPIFSQAQHVESPLALHVANCKDQINTRNTVNSEERPRDTFPFICQALYYDGKAFHAKQIVKNTPCSAIQRRLLAQQVIGSSL